MNYQYQEAIIKGVKDIIVDHYDSHQSVFDDFRNDEEFRKRVYEFISRGAIDICYCLMGGKHCHQCFIDGIISRHLTCINSLRLKDFLILMLQINERFKIK